MEKIKRALESRFGLTIWLLLISNTFIWTQLSYFVECDFWVAHDGYFWPFEERRGGGFSSSFSIEEWFVYAIGPWLIVYFVMVLGQDE